MAIRSASETASAARRLFRNVFGRCWRAILVSAALSLGFLGFLWYIGYFGGQIFAEVPAAAHRAPPVPGLGAVILSGDTGSRLGLSPQVAQRLAANGIPVITVNSLAYFGTRRTIAETQSLIADAARRALALPGVKRVALIGQSFGADMLQAGLPGLPEALRSHVLLVALIVPGDTLNFRASFQELLDFEKPDRLALPTAQQLDWVPALCIHGEVEQNSLCPLLHGPNIRRVALPGGHMLHRDADAVAGVLLRAIKCAAHASVPRAGPPCKPEGVKS